MRGYFAIGVEGVSKERNVGALLRTAHAFGASFVFVVAPFVDPRGFGTPDTSAAAESMPFYAFRNAEALALPQGCALVAVEITDDAVPLPSFRHPHRAAYVLGPERASVSPGLMARADHVIRIPTQFSLNLALTGGLVMYDRMISLGRFAERPVRPGGPPPDVAPLSHRGGGPRFRPRGEGVPVPLSSDRPDLPPVMAGTVPLSAWLDPDEH